MLRQIVLVSLAMTVCATIIPTKAKAATIILTDPDSNEIEIISTTEIEPPVPEDPEPSPDPPTPEFETPDYIDPPKGHPDHPLSPENSHIVPEPLTIFGTAIGLGCGVLLKRKSSKKKKS